MQACDILQGLPFPDNTFDVVYHSHVLEHLPKNEAPGFVKECFRVLNPGGILRIVIPDLEEITREYLRQLEANIENMDERTEANYDWIMLELLDQMVRNHSGGDMGKYLRQPEMINEPYVTDRVGIKARRIRKQVAARKDTVPAKPSIRSKVRQSISSISTQFIPKAGKASEFRQRGEVHLWMYDRFSLARLLTQAGFMNIESLSPTDSHIPEWSRYELDIKNGEAFDPKSLFMEATKPG